jgi:hypothetical protein
MNAKYNMPDSVSGANALPVIGSHNIPGISEHMTRMLRGSQQKGSAKLPCENAVE